MNVSRRDAVRPFSGRRIGFFGGMANNAYMAAKHFSDIGADVRFVRDRTDPYAMSQPVWEDCRFTLNFDQLLKTYSYTPEQWSDFEAQVEWERPIWFRDPLDEPYRVAATIPKNAPNELKQLFADHHLPLYSHRYLNLFKQCDWLFVSGIHSLALAVLADVPFFICPTGGEFLVASGLIDETVGNRDTLAQQKLLVQHAFRQTRSVVTSTAYYSHAHLTQGLARLNADYGDVPFDNVSLPFVVEEKISSDHRRSGLNALLFELGLPPIETKFAVFVPSRIDFKWKGQDRLFEAYSQCAHPDDFTFIISGWGADYEIFERMIVGRKNFQAINKVVSKPILYDLYRYCELTIDQFLMGHYGTATRESLAVGTPAVCWIDEELTRRTKGWNPAPVINVRSIPEITDMLNGISSGAIDLGKLATDGQNWINQHCSPLTVLEKLDKLAKTRRWNQSFEKWFT